MKKLLALLLTLLMVSVLAVSVSADTYDVNSETLKFRQAGGSGLSLGADGKTIILNQSNASNPAAHWSNYQLFARDSLKDGFTVKISNIVWDDDADNGVAIVYSNNPTSAHPSNISDTESCYVLIVKRDGGIVLWGNGYNTNHHMGKWAGVCETVNKVLSEKATEFTYRMVPAADGSSYSFYVNDTLIYKYDVSIAEMTSTMYHDKSIFARPDVTCNFGFMALDATGTYNTGWGTAPVGKLAYTIEEVSSTAVAPENPVIPGVDIGGDEGDEDTGSSDTQGGTADTTRPQLLTKPVTDSTADTTAPVGTSTDGSVNNVILIVLIATVAALMVVVVVLIVIILKKKKQD